MKKALTAVLIVLLALFMVACDSNPNDEQTPPPEEKTFTPDWVKRGDYTGYVVIREKITEELYEFVDATFTVDDDYILFTVMINGNELEFRADANNVNEKDVTITTDSWTMKVTDLDYPDGSAGKTDATVVVKNDESGKPGMTIDFEAAPYNNYIYSFEYEEPVVEPTFAPSWAVGEYSGKIMDYIPASLTINEDSFEIKVNAIIFTMDISSNGEGVEVLNSSYNDLAWELSLSGVEDPMDQENPIMDAPVDVVITNTKPNDTLTVKVTINDSTSSYEEINPQLSNIVFTITSTPTEA